jgi:hypothetical protein
MKFLAVTGARSEDEVRAYLYSHNIPLKIDTTYQGRVWAVIECPDDKAQYQADRFQSGMIGASVHDTKLDAAIAVIDRL